MNWHAGWVRKRGQLNTAFQDRYFVLADGVLRNYKTKEDFDKKHAEQSHLPCRGMTVSTSKSDGVRDFQFVLTPESTVEGGLKDSVNPHEVVISVDTAESRNIWISKLREAAELYKDLEDVSATVANSRGGGVAGGHDEDAASVSSEDSAGSEGRLAQRIKVPPLSSHGTSVKQRKHVSEWLKQTPDSNPIYRCLGISRSGNHTMGASANLSLCVCVCVCVCVRIHIDIHICRSGNHTMGASAVIHPMSSFNMYMQLTSSFLVLYTGVSTPAVLAFQVHF